MIVKGQDTGPETEIASVLGLVDFAITVHYGSSKVPYSSHALDKQLKELSEKTALRIYAIPERCALICDDGVLRLQGVVYLFYRGKKTRCK